MPAMPEHRPSDAAPDPSLGARTRDAVTTLADLADE
jgi:hypothetical protein